MKNIKYILPTIIAIIMLGVGIPEGLPYDYYTILRIVITIVAGVLAWLSFDTKQQGWGWIMVTVAILFNPIIPVYLAKGTWVMIDSLVIGIFLVSIFLLKAEEK